MSPSSLIAETTRPSSSLLCTVLSLSPSYSIFLSFFILSLWRQLCPRHFSISRFGFLEIAGIFSCKLHTYTNLVVLFHWHSHNVHFDLSSTLV